VKSAWTSEHPKKTGWYWFRYDEKDEPGILFICGEDCVEIRRGEWQPVARWKP
jgi:hypothetical protein